MKCFESFINVFEIASGRSNLCNVDFHKLMKPSNLTC